jgi:hypothetical protein
LKRDQIEEEELRRSVLVFFVSFLVIEILEYAGYIQINSIVALILAFIVTVIYYKVMVGYRKNEYSIDPSISSKIDQMLNRQKPEERDKGYTELGPDLRSILIILIIAYLVYRFVV